MRSMVETCKWLLRRLSKSNSGISVLNIEGEDPWHRLAGATLSGEDGPEPVELHDPTSNLACDVDASKLQEPAHEPASFAPIYVEERGCDPTTQNEPSAESTLAVQLSDPLDQLQHDEPAVEERTSEEEPLAAESLQAGEIPEVTPSIQIEASQSIQTSEGMNVCKEHLAQDLESVEGATRHYELLSLSPSVTGEETQMPFQQITDSASPSSPEIRSLISPDLQARIASFAIKVYQAYFEPNDSPERTSSDPLLLPPEPKLSVSFEEVSSTERSDDLACSSRFIHKPDALSQTGSYRKTREAVTSENRRRHDRVRLAIPTHVLGYGEDGQEWSEMAETVDISQMGAMILMNRRPKQHMILRLTLPLPERMRSYAFSDSDYSVYAVVRRIDLAGGGLRAVGLEFLGEHPPKAYLEAPWAVFNELRWSGGERRRMPREAHSSIVWIEYLNESLQCIGREAARTQDVSGGGMRIQVKAVPSDCEVLRISHSNCSFDTYAMVRSRFVGEDDFDHLCLRFLGEKPCAHPVAAQMQKIESEQSGGPRVAPKILLADDDASLRKVLGKILTQTGYEVSTAEDGLSAIEKAQVEKPDLVISDLLMPKGDGFHVCKMIKGLDSPPRIILFSGVFTKPHYRWQAREEYGADDMVSKPFELADLLSRIKKQLSSPSPA